MLTGEQIELRRSGVGGSDLGIIVGESHRMTARELYHLKRGELTVPETEDRAAFLGQAMEPALAAIYERETGRQVRNTKATRVHRDLEWAIAHADRLVAGRERGLEIKMRQSSEGWGYAGTDDVAIDVLLQCQWYMEIYRRQLWDVIVLFRGIEWRIYTVPRDQALIDTCIDIGAGFVEALRAGEPPEADFEHPTIESLVRRLHPESNGARLDLDPALEHWHHVRESAKRERDGYDAVYRKATAHLLAALGDAAVGMFPDGGMYNRKIVRPENGNPYARLTYKPAPRARS